MPRITINIDSDDILRLLNASPEHIWFTDIDLEEAREWIGLIDHDDFNNSLDEAQSYVFGEKAESTYVVIRISR